MPGPLAEIGGLLSGSALAAGHGLSIWLFLRLLGLVYLVAFVSLWIQIDGLIGSSGIFPVEELLARASGPSGEARPKRIPSLFWFDASDRALHVACAAGTASSLLVVLGLATAPALLLLWALYLSFAAVGRTFLSYQWDVLLLETGALAVLVAPWEFIPGSTSVPPNLALLLLWWLLFRLVFQSGVGKLSSGDSSWRDLTAMRFHWYTQPLPTPVAWYVSKLPDRWHRLATAATHVVEIGVPLLIFGPAEARWMAAGILIAFQLMIGLTGNYNFFNLLTAALCVLLVSDAGWSAVLTPELLDGWATVASADVWTAGGEPGPVRTWICAGAMIVWGLVSVPHVWRTARPDGRLPRCITTITEAVAPFRTINSYGLFRVMTRRRPEIVVEGSRDGEEWKRYDFKWKPGPRSRPPPWVQPHQPRLDWQMWFAALGSYRSTPWFQRFQARLLEGSEPVHGLLESVPLRDEGGPRYLRARLYEYRFTTREEKQSSGRWWARREIGRYGPPVERGERP